MHESFLPHQPKLKNLAHSILKGSKRKSISLFKETVPDSMVQLFEGGGTSARGGELPWNRAKFGEKPARQAPGRGGRARESGDKAGEPRTRGTIQINPPATTRNSGGGRRGAYVVSTPTPADWNNPSPCGREGAVPVEPSDGDGDVDGAGVGRRGVGSGRFLLDVVVLVVHGCARLPLFLFCCLELGM